MSEAEHLSRAIRGFFSDPQNGWFPPFVESIDGLTAAQVSWIPGEGLRSIWEISNHVRFYRDQLVAEGIVVEHAPRTYPWGRSAILRDPDGNWLELYEVKSTSR